jgi:hypothetical protein
MMKNGGEEVNKHQFLFHFFGFLKAFIALPTTLYIQAQQNKRAAS